VDYAVGRVVAEYARLGLLNNTLVVLTADHGMASNRHIVPIHPIYKAVAQTGNATLDEELRISVGSIWMQDPSHAAALAGALEKQKFNGVEGALYKTSSGTSYAAPPLTAGRLGKSLLKAYLDLADTEASPAGPEVILPYVEDATGLTVKGRKLWGNHGGFSWGVQHIPLVIAGPGVRHGVSHFPAKLVDIAPTMETLLGLQPPKGVDGVVLTDALKSSTPDERTAEEALRASRLADVNALRAHSIAQSKGQ
jgi:arylsulfatase A-like enzyme